MKNRSNIIFLSIIVIISSILFLIGCNNIFSPQNSSGNTGATIAKKTGGVSLSITKKDYRTLLPSFISIHHFDVTGDGPSGSSISLNDLTGDTVSISDLTVGEWTITALGKDSANKAIAKGSVSVNIVEGTTTDATIDVRYLQDATGTVNITITWPSDVSVDSIEFKKNSIDQTADVTSDLSFTGNNVNYLDSNAKSGFYSYVFKFKRNNQTIATVFQSVHVYDYLTTSASITLSTSSFSRPPAAPSGLSVVEGLASLNISWVDKSNVEEGFVIERKTSGGEFTAIGGTLPANTMNYIDSDISADATYYYRVKALNAFGSSAYSNEAHGVFALPTITAITPSSGLTGVPANTNIVISFDSEMSPSVFGTVIFSGVAFQDGTNCSMSISGTTLTINPNADFPGGVYNAIAVSGFKDISGNTMISYSESGYNFSVNGMIAYYPFDGTADDMSGKGNNMTLTTIYSGANPPELTFDRRGCQNSAYSISMGSSCYYMNTNITSVPSSFTISVWVYSSVDSMDRTIFSKFLDDFSAEDKRAEMCLKKEMSGNLKFFMGNGADLGLDINGNNGENGDLSNDKWHNVVITFDGTTGNMYIDGAPSGSGSFSGTRQNTTTPLYFGYYRVSSDYYYWNGKLDDIRIYNYALSETEVASVYNSEKPLPFGVSAISSPAIGAIVEPTTDIKIIFDATMDNQYNEVKISFANPPIDYFGGSYLFSKTYKDNDTVTFTPSGNYLPADTYSGITVTGFKDVGGSTMTEYENSEYNFKVRGKVAHFLFNESYSSVYQTHHYYTATGGNSPFFVAGKDSESGSAVNFNDGGNYYLDTNITKLDGDFTLSAWINYTGAEASRPIISKYNTSDANSQFNLQIDTNGNLNFFMGDGSGKGITLNGNNDPASDLIADNWYHVAVSMNGANGALYINGTETGSGSFTGTRQTGTNGINIGRYLSQYFKGKIDDVHIYNYALTAAEIRSIYITEKTKVEVASILSPANGTSDVSPDANIVIRFSGSLDGTTYGTMTFNQPDFTYTNGVNCSMSFATTDVTNDTVTINPYTNFVGRQYSTSSGAASISGFKDAEGADMKPYSSAYNFTPRSILIYYKLDGDMSDCSGYPGVPNRDGYNSNGNYPDLTTDRYGNPNRAYSFTAANGDAFQSRGGGSDGNYIGISGDQPRTLLLWVKGSPSPPASDQVICSLGHEYVLTPNDGSVFGLYVPKNTNNIGFYGYGDSYNFVTPIVIDSGWSHWAVSYDETNDVKIYKNGSFVYSENKLLNTDLSRLYVGADTNTQMNFDGCIDEVRLYNYALTADEILSIYNAEKPTP
ncbi:MAG TPA: Ig-like domain-containing protein [Spirochaetota bacterium]|nr:Ig-like domain-containing protein [Spirochaetota bacterium]